MHKTTMFFPLKLSAEGFITNAKSAYVTELSLSLGCFRKIDFIL